MSRISENIRKITRAWGGKTTGNGISDALLDLYNNLPFSVKKPLDYKFMPEGYPKVEMKMVEIVPEQSVTKIAETEGSHFFGFIDGVELKVGNKYEVTINGEKHTDTASTFEGVVLIGNPAVTDIAGGENANNNETYAMDTQPGTDFIRVTWSKTLGETITVQLIGEQEVVQQLDPKFVGGAVFYFKWADNYLYIDKECTTKTTKKDVETVMYSPIVLVDTSVEGEVFAIRANDVSITNDFAVVTCNVITTNGDSTLAEKWSYFTAEYTDIGGGGGGGPV